MHHWIYGWMTIINKSENNGYLVTLRVIKNLVKELIHYLRRGMLVQILHLVHRSNVETGAIGKNE